MVSKPVSSSSLWLLQQGLLPGSYHEFLLWFSWMMDCFEGEISPPPPTYFWSWCLFQQQIANQNRQRYSCHIPVGPKGKLERRAGGNATPHCFSLFGAGGILSYESVCSMTSGDLQPFISYPVMQYYTGFTSYNSKIYFLSLMQQTLSTLFPPHICGDCQYYVYLE